MNKYALSVLTLLILVGFSLSMSSCKDDEPTTPPQLSFDKSELFVNEADGQIEVKIKLDKPAPERFFIKYELDGTATDKVNAGQNAYDYEIKDDYLEAQMDKGDTEATIVIILFSDPRLEAPETILIAIKSVDTESVQITREDDMKITINQEDGMIVSLAWPSQTATDRADMDLLLRVGSSVNTWDRILAFSAGEGFTGPEAIFIPNALTRTYNAFGLSHTYYDGTFNPLNFTVTFIEVINGELEATAQRQVFNGKYTLANINKWEDPNTTKVVQTFLKSGSGFSNISDIVPAPAGGSRQSDGNEFSTSKFRKNSGIVAPSKFMQSVLNELK